MKLVRHAQRSSDLSPRGGVSDEMRNEPPTSPIVQISDRALVVSAKAGDSSALMALYRRHWSPVANVLARLMGSSDDAQDLTQEAFVIAFDSLKVLEDGAAFRSWTMRIAIRLATRTLAQRRRRSWLLRWANFESENGACLSQYAHSSSDPEQVERLTAIDRVLGRVPIETRVAWMLRHVEGHSLLEVADLCGVSLATAKRHIAAGHAALESIHFGGKNGH
jgi:RNA polymerase sigma-70 factor, ECF subfamily